MSGIIHKSLGIACADFAYVAGSVVLTRYPDYAPEERVYHPTDHEAAIAVGIETAAA